jgi:hypothetical protein
MTLFQNLLLFTNHYVNLQEMLEMAYLLKYVDLYLTSEWGRFYVGHPVLFRRASASKSSLRFCTHLNYTVTVHTPLKIQTKKIKL